MPYLFISLTSLWTFGQRLDTVLCPDDKMTWHDDIHNDNNMMMTPEQDTGDLTPECLAV